MTLRQITLKWQEYSITFTEWIKERPELITMATEVHIQVKFVRLWYNCLGERQAWVESYSGRIKVGDLEGLDGGPQLQGQPECHYQVEPASTLTIKKNSRLLIIITLLLCQIFTISKNMFRKQIFSEQSTTLHTWHMPTFLEERWMNLIHFLLHRMTQCQDEFRNLSGCVIKILTGGRILQISIAWCQIAVSYTHLTLPTILLV